MRNPEFVAQSIHARAGGKTMVEVEDGYISVFTVDPSDDKTVVTFSSVEARALASLLQRAASNLEPTGRGEMTPQF